MDACSSLSATDVHPKRRVARGLVVAVVCAGVIVLAVVSSGVSPTATKTRKLQSKSCPAVDYGCGNHPDKMMAARCYGTSKHTVCTVDDGPLASPFGCNSVVSCDPPAPPTTTCPKVDYGCNNDPTKIMVAKCEHSPDALMAKVVFCKVDSDGGLPAHLGCDSLVTCPNSCPAEDYGCNNDPAKMKISKCNGNVKFEACVEDNNLALMEPSFRCNSMVSCGDDDTESSPQERVPPTCPDIDYGCNNDSRKMKIAKCTDDTTLFEACVPPETPLPPSFDCVSAVSCSPEKKEMAIPPTCPTVDYGCNNDATKMLVAKCDEKGALFTECVPGTTVELGAFKCRSLVVHSCRQQE